LLPMEYRPPHYDRLLPHEARWRDRQPFLQSKGYILRPRLRSDWQPSWLGTDKHPLEFEDAYFLPLRTHLVDATRMSDDKMVYIKRVKTGDQESSIASILHSEGLRKDPRNHSVPILDQFTDLEDPSISYMVMPFLREPYSPQFANIAEFVDFVDQILTGLVFMHESGVAHRDCALPNVMMDASAMYPKGFHPTLSSHLADGFTPAPVIPRTQARVRYYFIDYGISSYFPPGQPRGLVTGTLGRDQDVPELSDTVPYDPFAVDIFIIGNLFRQHFDTKYTNVEFMKPIIEAATQRDPARRPKAPELLRLWNRQRRSISVIQKSWRLRGRDESAVGRVMWDCFNVAESVFSFAGGLVRRK